MHSAEETCHEHCTMWRQAQQQHRQNNLSLLMCCSTLPRVVLTRCLNVLAGEDGNKHIGLKFDRIK